MAPQQANSTKLPETLTSPPPPHSPEYIILSFPLPHVLLVTFNRVSALNAVNHPMRLELEDIFKWFEDEPDLWVAVVTGAGRTFCAGADLKEWKEDQERGKKDMARVLLASAGAFASLSTRRSNKTLIGAINGPAFGGGVEIIVNLDLVIANEKATFGFPEPKVGVVVASGAIPRIVRIAGHQKASELLLTNKTITAKEARDIYGFVNEVVPADKVLSRALEYASMVTALSPDSIRSTKRAINDSHAHGNVHDAWAAHATSPESDAMYEGKNIMEGLAAFSQRRKPNWSTYTPLGAKAKL